MNKLAIYFIEVTKNYRKDNVSSHMYYLKRFDCLNNELSAFLDKLIKIKQALTIKLHSV